MPPPRQFDDADRWHIGKPDLIVPMPKVFTVKTEAADWWGIFEADSGLTEDRYIKAVEAKPSPGARRVVHHSVETLVYDDGSSGGGTLVEYAVGKNGDMFPEGSGKLMKAGAKVRFNMHYHAIGEPVTDRTEVGIVFYPKGVVPKHVITTILSPNQDDLDIPAGADNVRSDAYFKMEKPSHLVGFMPHMHNRGKRQCLEAIYPDMHVEQLNCVNYDFNWQIVYNYADDVAPLLPAGTIMHVISWHDNSAGQQVQPRSAQLGRLRQPHDRRHVAPLADLLHDERRGVQSRDGRAQRAEERRAPASREQSRSEGTAEIAEIAEKSF